MQHSHQVAVIGHALGVIRNTLYDGHVNPDRIAVLGAFHDMGEVFTGDMPTPIKYFNPDIRKAFSEIERRSEQRLFEMVPQELQEEYKNIFFPAKTDTEHLRLVKAADTISAYLKCLEEVNVGNLEFSSALKSIEDKLKKLELPEVEYFLETFVPSFSLTLDELTEKGI